MHASQSSGLKREREGKKGNSRRRTNPGLADGRLGRLLLLRGLALRLAALLLLGAGELIVGAALLRGLGLFGRKGGAGG